MILVDNRKSTNPFVNIAIEDYLIRNADMLQDDFIMLYVNKPCVVIGRNQSLYKEVNFEYLQKPDSLVARRISGGGAVYHDSGNLSFSFISKFENYKLNNYKHFNQPVINALNRIGVKAAHDSRNNIICHGKKISGNAQFTNRRNILSHGTLLFDADLNQLRNALQENNFKVESRAIASVRSSVMNLKELNIPLADIDKLKEILLSEVDITSVLAFSDTEWKEIEESAYNKFSSFDWIYGRSPKTKILKKNVEVTVESGKVVSVSNSLFQMFVGVSYEYKKIRAKILNESLPLSLLEDLF